MLNRRIMLNVAHIFFEIAMRKKLHSCV